MDAMAYTSALAISLTAKKEGRYEHFAPPISTRELSALIIPGMLGPMATQRATRARQLIPAVSVSRVLSQFRRELGRREGGKEGGGRERRREGRTVVDSVRVVELDNVVLLLLDEEVVGREDRSDRCQHNRVRSHERDLSHSPSGHRSAKEGRRRTKEPAEARTFQGAKAQTPMKTATICPRRILTQRGKSVHRSLADEIELAVMLVVTTSRSQRTSLRSERGERTVSDGPSSGAEEACCTSSARSHPLVNLRATVSAFWDSERKGGTHDIERLPQDLAVDDERAVGRDGAKEGAGAPEGGDEEDLHGRRGLLLAVPTEIPNVARERRPRPCSSSALQPKAKSEERTHACRDSRHESVPGVQSLERRSSAEDRTSLVSSFVD